MRKTLEKVDKQIIAEVAREFPGDPALQQLHIARLVVSREAKENGLNLQEYIENYSKK